MSQPGERVAGSLAEWHAEAHAESAAEPPAERLVEIALPLPLLRNFTYAVRGATRHPLVQGSRVVVPVRNRRVVGYCVGEATRESLRGATAREILDVPDAEPALRADLLNVCRWISGYYVVPLGLVCRAVLPAALGVAAKPQAAEKAERVLVIADELPTLMAREQAFKRAPQQRQLYELLEQLGGRAAVTHLVERLGCSLSVVNGLVKRGHARLESQVVSRDPFLTRAVDAPPTFSPTPDQQRAIDAILVGRGTFLLHGITGSGKTLVYLQVLEQVVRRDGRSAIVLVPEIALTPQAVDRFRAVFGDLVAVLHSGLSDGERLDAWRALQRGEKRIAVGARSAVFAPLADLGAIIVDEEHEASYKQAETPRYHARDVAIMRARESGALCVLGSATPSLESWVNAREGRSTLLTLPARVGGGALPAVNVIDLRQEMKVATSEERARRLVLSAPLERALHDRLARGEQSILLLNRRGYASFVQCDEGHVAVCPNCSISLTYHRTPERLVCHYCLHQEDASRACTESGCGLPRRRQRGLGTQQVEQLLRERLPTARIARMDVDTTSGKWAHTEILDRVGRGDIDILLGTQMIAKGLDFPNVTLVGVVDADIGINLPDFRASERSFQLLSQVAGRAGRGPKGGEVFIQTRVPSHHAVRCAMTHDYQSFVDEELPARESPAYPPTVRIANIVVSGLDEAAVAACAADVTKWLSTANERFDLGIFVLGPAPCALERIKTRWRWHVVLKTEHPPRLTRLLRGFLTGFDVPAAHDMRVIADRDPVSLL